MNIFSAKRLSGSISVPGDKSISHRALIFGAMAEGVTEVAGLSNGEDVQSTQKCLRQLGIQIEGNRIYGGTFHPPTEPLDCGNSGTTMRLLMGLLSALPFASTLVGDASLSKRPMGRIALPLTQMGASIIGEYPPVRVRGGALRGIDYSLPVASAQLKSAILLAALFAKGTTRLTGFIQSRNHTEEMLQDFGVDLIATEEKIEIAGEQKLYPCRVNVPGDPSSAAFWAAAAAIVPGSSVTIRNVMINSTRMGFFHLLQKMGGDITFGQNITVRYAPLRGVAVGREEIPQMVDEVPLIAILGAHASGVTQVTGAEELRIKESDRIRAVVHNLQQMGCRIIPFEDGFSVEGPQKLTGAILDSFGDHRIAMAFAIAALAAKGETTLVNAEAASVSYPNFYRDLESLRGE